HAGTARPSAPHPTTDLLCADLSKLGTKDIKRNLLKYVDSFSKDAREIFEHFRFDEFIGQLDEANLLFKVVQRVANTDLHPEVISNHDMGLVFEELIRRFAESSNETADRKSTRLNSSHVTISYAVFCLKKKRNTAWIASTATADIDPKEALTPQLPVPHVESFFASICSASSELHPQRRHS